MAEIARGELTELIALYKVWDTRYQTPEVASDEAIDRIIDLFEQLALKVIGEDEEWVNSEGSIYEEGNSAAEDRNQLRARQRRHLIEIVDKLRGVE